jgi:hypothetical protein
MKLAIYAIVVVLAVTLRAQAQSETTILARTGLKNSATSYHFLEIIHSKGAWIAPDIGYIDFSTGDYREVFIGVGKVLHGSKRSTLVGEVYVDQALGPVGKGALYLQPFMAGRQQLSDHWTIRGVYFLYLPLNKAGIQQHVLENIKLEREWKKYKLGAGYSGYKFGSTSWQHKPFVTATLATERLGSFEVWLQKLPRSSQVQIRYSITIK